MAKIAFHSNQLCLRGTEIALFDYAKYNEEILGNESVIFSFPNANMDALEKFKSRFNVVLHDFWNYESYCQKNSIEYLYCIKMGSNDGFCLQNTKTLVHAVFQYNEPHGHRYAYVSDWLCRDQKMDVKTHSVPHMVYSFGDDRNMRDELGIPLSATVFGCYGGSTEFNIHYVHEAINNIIKQRNNIYFIFMNINKFIEHPQVIFLPGSYDMYLKSKFINTCDAMLHARMSGETFGLAVAEFSIKNKPVITCSDVSHRNHIEILGDHGIYYNSYDTLYEILDNFTNKTTFEYSKLYTEYSSENIMTKFHKVFLQ